MNKPKRLTLRQQLYQEINRREGIEKAYERAITDLRSCDVTIAAGKAQIDDLTRQLTWVKGMFSNLMQTMSEYARNK